ncbi:CoA binding domain-containing protein [Rhexocercosporidium sp. MPI-PUGE-AT-0058]|nr:CoA binding domain-containing protein [Rhexocercosporidium sp. MPI-PUGE-AT-0058]
MKMATEAAAKAFFSAPHFAVVGASSDPTKFGHKIFTWYTHHNLPVTPINPTSPEIKAYPPYPAFDIKAYATLPNLSALPNPTETSVSIITPPKVTMKVLEEAKKLGVQGVWLQPGSFDDDVLGFAMREFKAAVGGDGGRGSEGWCVLVDGERAAKAAGKSFKL